MDLLKHILLVIPFTIISLSAQADSSSFQSGIDAFKLGNYSEALRHFQIVESRGASGPQLIYNIGSTLYKLERYRQSESYFRRLVDKPKWRQLSLYNIALIAERTGNPLLAQHYYVQVLRSPGESRAKRLAQAKINQIDNESPEKKGFASASLFAGVDDNAIAFADDLQSSSSAVRDNFIDVYVFGQRNFATSSDTNSRLQGFLYNKTYQDLSSLNVSVLGASWIQSLSSGVERGINLITSTIDGATAYHQVELYLFTELPFVNRGWKFSYQPSYFSGGSDYEQLDGWQHRLSASKRWRWNFTAASVRIGAEINNRDELKLGSSRYSYSPTRLSLDASLRWYQTTRLTYTMRGVVAHSQYSGKNQFEDLDGVVKDKQRRANKIRLSLEVNYDLAENWALTGKIEHTDNRENFDYYTYDRNLYALGMSYTF